jgi:filamentous hemagglutinin
VHNNNICVGGIGHNQGPGLDDVSDFQSVFDSVSPKVKGRISGLDTDVFGVPVVPTLAEDKALVAAIIKNGDPKGILTEKLVESVAESQGIRSLQGGKYGSNNGFDHTFTLGQDSSGNVTLLLMDSKQMSASGSMKLSIGAGGQLQLSENWVTAVLGKLNPNSEAFQVTKLALDAGTLRTAVAGVDKIGGTLIMLPVKVVP